MSRINYLKIKKILKELDYIESDYEYKSEIVSESDPEFIRNINIFLERYPELKGMFDKYIGNKIDNTIKKNTDEIKKNEFEDNIEIHEEDENTEDIINVEEDIKISKTKGLYRDIVKLTHPDKVNNKKLNDIYIKSTKLYNDNNLPGLYLICEELKLDYDIEDDDISDILDRINLLKERIGFIHETFTWKWLNSSSDDERDQIILAYVKMELIRGF